MTILDHFEYGTWDIQKNAKETISRLGYRYEHLAVIRTDFKHDACDELHECWSIANLASGCYPFPGAIFRTIDDAATYVYEITSLASWDTINIEQTRKLVPALIKACLTHNGIPIAVFRLLTEDKSAERGVLPGTIAGLNGYTKQ